LDITFISTRQGWLFLAVVMDLYSRRIVGWAMDRRAGRHMVLDAMTMALGYRQPALVLLHHSDRGPQYTSDDFRDLLDSHGIQCRMSARGHCYDNAPVERFFSLLKRERIRPGAPTRPGSKPRPMSLTTSKCSTIGVGVTRLWIISAPWSSKIGP
jgi:putative transposase